METPDIVPRTAQARGSFTRRGALGLVKKRTGEAGNKCPDRSNAPSVHPALPDSRPPATVYYKAGSILAYYCNRLT
jgi:hypothetical protein